MGRLVEAYESSEQALRLQMQEQKAANDEELQKQKSMCQALSMKEKSSFKGLKGL